MKRIILSIVLLCLFLPITAHAQQDSFAGYYIQSASSGALTDNGDGTYTLTLENVPVISSWVIISPQARAGNFETRIFTDDWAFLADYTRSAMLETDGITFYLTLTNPTFDDIFYTATYQAIIDDTLIFSDEITEPPTELGRATLFISTDNDFQAQLDQAFIDRNKEGRPDALRPPNSAQCCGDPRTVQPVGGANQTVPTATPAEAELETTPTLTPTVDPNSPTATPTKR